MDNDTYRIHRKELVEVIRYLSQKGWVPATSSNFSTKIDDAHISISRSGVDKSEFTEDDLIVIDFDGEVLFPNGERSSAETLIHTAIYNHFENIDCVLHTHSVNGTLLSRLISNRNEYIEKDQLGTFFEGYEVQKAFWGTKSHEGKIFLPVFFNSQDMIAFSKELSLFLQSNTKPLYGFLIVGHGLYTWGRSISESKRHIEAFEFLMECDLMERRLGLK